MSDLSFQVRAPPKLELVSGDILKVENWSLRGIEFPGNAEVLPQKAQLSIPFQGVDIQFPVPFKPADEEGWLEFDELTGRQRETLAVFYRSILSGKMASTEEVITSLDTPVDLIPMGETDEEVRQVMADLRAADCDILTIGQYLQPTQKHLGVNEFVTPEQFDQWREAGEAMGFLQVVSSPLTRSSYHAEQVQVLMKQYPR